MHRNEENAENIYTTTFHKVSLNSVFPLPIAIRNLEIQWHNLQWSSHVERKRRKFVII